MLDEDKDAQSWMWVFATDEVVPRLYYFRGGFRSPIAGALEGTLTVDGHTGYNLVTQAGHRRLAQRLLVPWPSGGSTRPAATYSEALVDGLLVLMGELFLSSTSLERGESST